jgi:hypothetical protein
VDGLVGGGGGSVGAARGSTVVESSDSSEPNRRWRTHGDVLVAGSQLISRWG